MTPRSLLAPARLAGQPILRSQTDERLVDLARAGHEPAFEAIVARYRRPLLRYCGRILSDERAEDAVQQTFVKAYDAMRRDDNELNLRPWLYRIAHNTALNGLRDKGLQDEPLDLQIDGVERPDQAAERREGVREVLAAVQALPTRQRDAIVLRELEGRSYEEIAGALGVTGGAVRQLLNRARTTLRAAATAIVPVGLLLRLWSGEGEPTAARVGELVGAGGAGALATKVAATALVTGAVAGGIATVPDREAHRARPTEAPAAEAAVSDDAGSGDRGASAAEHRASSTGQASDQGRGSEKSGKADSDDSTDATSGSGSGGNGGDDDSAGDHSGPGGDDDD